jgi:hypothetical protein
MLALVIGGAAWAMTLGYRRLGASGDALAAARDGE